jgi:hypothetical protein
MGAGELATGRACPPWATAGVLVLVAVTLLAAPPAGAADVVPPTVDIEAPLDGHLYNVSATGERADSSKVEATALITDKDTPVGQLSVSFVLVPDYSLVAQNGSFTVTFTPVGATGLRASVDLWLPDGTYTLTWVATDTGGNTSSAASTFSVDLQPPAMAAAAPPMSRDPDVWVTVDIVDAVAGVDPDDVRVLFRSACNSTWVDVFVTFTSLGGHVVGEAPLRLCEGKDNVLQVLAVDRAGHWNSTGVIWLTLDTQAPTFSGHRPASFTTTDGPQVGISAFVVDAVAGTNTSSVEVQVSPDAGLTWGPWVHPTVRSAAGGGWMAVTNATLPPGASVAVRWRAFDHAGNGPGEQEVVHFNVNGPPFLISFTPQEGFETLEGREITFSARFADPDADTVKTSFYSDIDGHIGDLRGLHEADPSGDWFKRVLSLGVHNITVDGQDGHGNRAVYMYQISVVVRPPPDLLPFAFIPLMGVALAAAAWLAWRRAEDLDEEA